MSKWRIEDIERLQEKGKTTQTKAPIAKKVKLPKLTANALTKYALKVLDLKGFHVWRQNNGGVYDTKLKCFRANSSTPGISDIIGFHRRTGQFIACEIKAGNDKLSEEQERFLLAVNRAGGIGMVVRTIDELEAFYKNHNSEPELWPQIFNMAAGIPDLSKQYLINNFYPPIKKEHEKERHH